MIERRKEGLKIGMPSYCTANDLAIEALNDSNENTIFFFVCQLSFLQK